MRSTQVARGAQARPFGPGLVSGASANDPTTVASLAVVGASTGYALAWLVVLLLPMLAIVQTIAAHVAAVSRSSLQETIARTYGPLPALASLAAVVVIGLMTLTADVKAGAEAVSLITGIAPVYVVIPFVLAAGWLLVTHSYLHIERVLAWCTLIFLAYAASAVLARPDWSAIVHAIVVPHLSFAPAYVAGAIALLGTTLTSYEYFWESIEVAERRPRLAQLQAFKADAAIGMFVTGSSFIFVLIATAATGHHSIQTPADVASALKPLAGSLDQALFGVGLFASAAIAIPVIASTNGYVVAQTFGWKAGLESHYAEARPFYHVIFASLACAACIALLPIPTIAMLYWVSIAAGIATPLTLVFTLLVARNTSAMGVHVIGGTLAAGGWIVTLVVTAASVLFFCTQFKIGVGVH